MAGARPAHIPPFDTKGSASSVLDEAGHHSALSMGSGGVAKDGGSSCSVSNISSRPSSVCDSNSDGSPRDASDVAITQTHAHSRANLKDAAHARAAAPCSAHAVPAGRRVDVDLAPGSLAAEPVKFGSGAHMDGNGMGALMHGNPQHFHIAGAESKGVAGTASELGGAQWLQLQVERVLLS